MIHFFRQWMICGLSSGQACSGYSTLILHPRPAHHGISTKTRRLSRRKARPYRKAKFSNNIEGWDKYKSLKAETQRDMRRAHQAYIQNNVNQDLTSNSKRFTHMSKARDKKPRVFHHCSTNMISYTVVTPVRLTS